MGVPRGENEHGKNGTFVERKNSEILRFRNFSQLNNTDPRVRRGGDKRDRTADLLNAIGLLCKLTNKYTSIWYK